MSSFGVSDPRKSIEFIKMLLKLLLRPLLLRIEEASQKLNDLMLRLLSIEVIDILWKLVCEQYIWEVQILDVCNVLLLFHISVILLLRLSFRLFVSLIENWWFAYILLKDAFCGLLIWFILVLDKSILTGPGLWIFKQFNIFLISRVLAICFPRSTLMLAKLSIYWNDKVK